MAAMAHPETPQRPSWRCWARRNPRPWRLNLWKTVEKKKKKKKHCLQLGAQNNIRLPKETKDKKKKKKNICKVCKLRLVCQRWARAGETLRRPPRRRDAVASPRALAGRDPAVRWTIQHASAVQICTDGTMLEALQTSIGISKTSLSPPPQWPNFSRLTQHICFSTQNVDPEMLQLPSRCPFFNACASMLAAASDWGTAKRSSSSP